MKKLISLIGVLFLVAFLQSCTQESAVDYNNGIIEHQQEIVYKIDNLKKAIDKYNILPQDEAIDLMNAAYDSVIFQIDTSLSYISKVEDFNGDMSLKDAAQSLFVSYKDIIEGDYKKIIELYKIPDAMFSVSDQQALDSLLEGSNQKLDDVLTKFVAVHTEFADKNNLVIE
ncbi:MAG: hypothetical protein JXR68_00460 [Bacteroidales bacterium]|nr:hypothetical protein [Bacteroidales bacterium]